MNAKPCHPRERARESDSPDVGYRGTASDARKRALVMVAKRLDGLSTNGADDVARGMEPFLSSDQRNSGHWRLSAAEPRASQSVLSDRRTTLRTRRDDSHLEPNLRQLGQRFRRRQRADRRDARPRPSSLHHHQYQWRKLSAQGQAQGRSDSCPSQKHKALDGTARETVCEVNWPRSMIGVNLEQTSEFGVET
jgi:hypothetical protein